MTSRNEQVEKLRQLGKLKGEFGIAGTVGVGRIGEDEIERAGHAVSAFEKSEGVGSTDGAALKAGFCEVSADDLAGSFVLIHKEGRGSSAAEGLEPEGT